ncbi:MAG TPA: hypothetical protein VMW27_14115 [Thermoanaerobaculia bacterium]|nr:hypothetical protein [Thermoanaerobaculia bacterium]
MPSSTQSSRIPSVPGLVLLCALLVGAMGCATQGRPAPGTPNYPELEKIYNASVANSAVYRANHQVANLWPVSMDETTPMVSFISCDNCSSGGGSGGGCSSGGCSSKCILSSPGSQKAPSDIWVSRADQVLAYCQSLPQDLTAAEVILKIQQLQGLPPQVNSDPCTWQILQLDVGGLKVPEEFFRPCTNPDPTTTGPCTAVFADPDPHIEFQAWMAGQAFSSWQIPCGYPWTHLGYTYNWDPNNRNPKGPSIVGTSEYVIRQGTTVDVVGLVPAVPYCTQNRLTCP